MAGGRRNFCRVRCSTCQLRATSSGRAPLTFRGGAPLGKLLTGAIAVSATLALAAGAIADPNDGRGDADGQGEPGQRRHEEKPKNTTLSFNMKVTKPGTTVEVIDVLLPAGTKFSGKGFKKCDPEELLHGGVSACPSGSKAGGKGVANALVGVAGAPLNFDVYPFVGDADPLLYYLSQQGGRSRASSGARSRTTAASSRSRSRRSCVSRSAGSTPR